MVEEDADPQEEQTAFEEIDLYGELIIAAGALDRPLTRAELDAVLGLDPPPS